MPNRNYEKGRRKEYKIVRNLEKQGYDIVQRTAGSHSPFDIIAIDTQKGVILLVQSKPESMGEEARKKLLLDEYNRFGTNGDGIRLFMVKFAVE